MGLPDLKKLLDNCTDTEIEVVSAIALRIAGLRADGYTGEISFSVNANQGAVGDVHIHRREVVSIKRKARGVRSGGIL